MINQPLGIIAEWFFCDTDVIIEGNSHEFAPDRYSMSVSRTGILRMGEQKWTVSYCLSSTTLQG